MQISQIDAGRSEHPVDVVEQLAAGKDWAFERADADEISISVSGLWSDYQAAFTWLDEFETLHIGCAFDLKVPARTRAQIQELISRINEQMWLGHFDHWAEESVIMFRHSILLSGGAAASQAQCEALLAHAITSCERYYQAFQFVLWAGKSAREALETANFETRGEA